jgi:hypothetical protein
MRDVLFNAFDAIEALTIGEEKSLARGRSLG